jgi:Do/DeqQ family serine protease
MIKYSSFLILVFTLFALSGCKSPIIDYTSENQKTEEKSQSQQPIVVDGNRTSYADVVEKVTPAVVNIKVEVKAKKQPQMQQQDFPFPFPFPQQQQPQGRQRPQIGAGSGIIMSADGTVLTNNHVVEDADKIIVEMSDKKEYTAKVVGTDPPSDLAVLKIEGKDFPFLSFGDSEKVRVGDVVLAIGNPLGIGQTVTQGIISAKNRRTNLGGGVSFEDFLQTDAPINRGNSGGALVNLNGELIGINSQILSTTGGSIGIGFAIPSSMAKDIMEQLSKDGKVQRGMLGIGIQDLTEELAESLDMKGQKGVLVNNVTEGSAAEKAGIKKGDVITAINDEKVVDGNSLRNKVAATKPGSEMKLTVLRDGKQQEVTAKLDEYSLEKAKNSVGQGNDGEDSEEKAKSNGKLGLSLQPLTSEIAKHLGLPATIKGLVVTEIDPEGAAAEKDIQQGDVITEINGKSVETLEDVQTALEGSGDKAVRLLLNRKGGQTYITVKPKQ